MKTQTVSEGLLLAGSATEVTQAVEMAPSENAAYAHVAFMEASGDLTMGNGVRITIEGSDDLENWTDMMSAFQVTAFPDCPENVYVPSSQPMEDIRLPYLRLKYENLTNETIYLNATLSSYQRAG